METNQVLADMLKENTGTHFLDSGGAYGRHWEENQERDFSKEESSIVAFRAMGDSTEICVTHNVYHWLSERLDYDERMDALFRQWADLPANDEKYWLELMEEFATRLDGAGIYGEGNPVTVNTYNGEDLLSQTIQYTYFEVREDQYGPPTLNGEDEDGELLVESGSYVLLQIHGGCDVRGGYTAPKVFRLNENHGEMAIFDNARASIMCEQTSEHYWYTDDGYHYYDNGCCGGEYKQLETYPSEELDEPPKPAILHPDLFEKNNTPGEYEHKGTVIVCDEKGYCPLCGGRLMATY